MSKKIFHSKGLKLYKNSNPFRKEDLTLGRKTTCMYIWHDSVTTLDQLQTISSRINNIFLTIMQMFSQSLLPRSSLLHNLRCNNSYYINISVSFYTLYICI